MDQKIALLGQRVLSHQNGFLPDTDTHTDTYFLSKAGGGGKTRIELKVTGDIGVGRFFLRIFGREIRMTGAYGRAGIMFFSCDTSP